MISSRDKLQIELNEPAIWKWYLFIEEELELNYLSKTERSFLFDYYREAGLLRWWRKPFFRHHFARTFFKALEYIFNQKKPIHILDLGCGTGTQSLYFGLMGAQVTAVDIDKTALKIFKKRKFFYESYFNQKLLIDIRLSNIFELDFDSLSPINAIYSMFAFNMMQPSKLLLTILSDHSEPGCRLAILDGNNRSWLPRLIPSRKREHCLSPTELKNELAKRSFNVVAQTPGFCIPPIIWTFFPTPFLRKIDTLLGRSPLFAISYQTLAIKE